MKPISRDRLALGSYHYLRYPLEYFLDTAVELGLTHVELWAAAPHLFPELLTAGDYNRIRSQLRGRGLSVTCVTPEQCTYPVNLASEDQQFRQYSIRYMERAIQASVSLDCPRVLVTAGCGRYDRPTEESWKLAQDSLYRLALTAQREGLTLLLETLTPISSNLISTPEQQMDMISHLPEGSTYPMLDVGQMAYMNQTLEQYLVLGQALQHVHLQDSHPAVHMALGDGDLPLEAWLRKLESSGYTGSYSFEFNDARYRAAPREADKQSVDWLQSHSFLE